MHSNALLFVNRRSGSLRVQEDKCTVGAFFFKEWRQQSRGVYLENYRKV